MIRQLFLLLVLALSLAACGTTPPPPPDSAVTPSGDDTAANTTDPDADPDPDPDADPDTDAATNGEPTATTAPIATNGESRPIKVAFPYIPNVQFAPYYVAASKGYYAEAGLDVSFEYMYENEAVQLVALGDAEFGFFSGISVLLARQNEMPVVTVATITHETPVVFFATAEHPLNGVEDLPGKRIGIPGRFGASYYGLLAVLYANDMAESDLDLHDIGFNQVQMLQEGKVDVAMGYATNEPVQLAEMGEEVEVLRVADVYPLVSDGIVTTEQLIADEPELVRSFVVATLRGVEDILADPDEGFELSLEYIPEADLGDVDFQRKVFDASLPYWESEQGGQSDPQMWQQTYDFLVNSSLLTSPLEVSEGFSNQFVQ